MPDGDTTRVNATALADRYGRVKRKLRLSLTDRCNFRCRYCLPQDGAHPRWMPAHDRLSAEQLFALAGAFVDLGITAIRLTGGEPLLRADVPDIARRLNTLRARGLERLSLTTNGSRLAEVAGALRAAGIDDINVSLDSVDPARFARLTGAPLAPVLAGIHAAQAVGLPLKLNCVLVRGHNDDDILALTEWALARALPLRFIEYMPLDAPGHWRREEVISEAEILSVLRTRYAITAVARSSDPATPYRLDGHYELGVISTVSRPFCASCDRLRLTARGDLHTCLFATQGTPLAALEGEALVRAVRTAVWNKNAGYADGGAQPGGPGMHVLGG